MKKLFVLLALALSIGTYAQPVINNSNNMPPVGYSDTVAIVFSGVNPGTSGANVTWDFSSLAPTIAGTFKIVSPAATPYGSAFPTATTGIELTPFSGGSMYEYYVVSASKWEVVGSGITGTSGDVYTTNPKTIVPFPFAYSNAVTDTFTKSSGTYTLDITYDGYGTLITPYATYNNVARVKREFGGNDYYYDWFITSPYLMTVASYDNNTGKITFIGKSMITSVNDLSATALNVTLSPNPVAKAATFTIKSDKAVNGKVTISDISGRKVATLSMSNSEAHFSREILPGGVYFYNIVTAQGASANGKFIIE